MADKEEKKPEEKKEEKPAPKDNLVVTQHTVRIGGKEIPFRSGSSHRRSQDREGRASRATTSSIWPA